jgi:two-component sensor histidine kinase
MREMHHRIKNNLAMVASLIELKQVALGDSVNVGDLIDRIETFRSIHEMLSAQDTVSLEIPVDRYLTTLIERICRTFPAGPVDLSVSIPKITVPTHVAVPLGLIVTELTTNAVKYGFTPGNAAFRVSLELDHDDRRNSGIDGEPRTGALLLSNGGNPLPPEFEITSQGTLGMHLVRALTSQIKGTLSFRREPETTFIVRFPMVGSSSARDT